MVTAKGLTNGVIPMGAVFVKKEIYDAFMNGPEHHHRVLPRLHLFGQSGGRRRRPRHPRDLRGGGPAHPRRRAGRLLGGRLHALKDLPHVIDIRNCGLVGAIELEPIAGAPTKRAFTAFLEAFEKGLLIRTTGDIIALSPPLIVDKAEIDRLFETLAGILKNLA